MLLLNLEFVLVEGVEDFIDVLVNIGIDGCVSGKYLPVAKPTKATPTSLSGLCAHAPIGCS